MKQFLKSIGIWGFLFILTDLFFIFITWLIRPEVMHIIFIVLLLFTLFSLGIGYLLTARKQKTQQLAFQIFLKNPNESTKDNLQNALPPALYSGIDELYLTLHTQLQEMQKIYLDLQNYQEYIEAWTHEIKTPISLMTLLLENHKDEITPYFYTRMEHVKYQLNENVTRILYYARLQANHKDHQFTHFLLNDCILGIVQDFSPILQEKNINLLTNISPISVFSDKNIIAFIFTQIFSNAIKYAPLQNGKISISICQNNKENIISLTVEDNGHGIAPEDLPFIFDKGFTGDHVNRQNATGMGLYFANKYAQALAISIEPCRENSLGGFSIAINFPIVL